MKYFISTALLAGLAGCAGQQLKIDHVQAQLNCAVDTIQPYAELLEESTIKQAVAGLDVTEALMLALASKEEAEKVAAALKACKNLPKPE